MLDQGEEQIAEKQLSHAWCTIVDWSVTLQFTENLHLMQMEAGKIVRAPQEVPLLPQVKFQ